MANLERGEVGLEFGGELLTLKLTTAAAATLQARHKKTVGELIRATDDIDVVAIQGILWALLQKHHAAKFKNEVAAGEVMDEVGFKVVMDKIQEAFMVNSDPNPQQAQETAGGTSIDSTSTPAQSA